MAQVCSKCSHPNPPEAIYCYFDGVTLGGRSSNGGPVRAGSQPFPSQFVFPSGQACRNFDQLATTCQQNWGAAVDLLKQGFLASFLAGIGRADLAMAAKEASRFPDIDRGLDRFLAKLPTHVLDAPKLRAEPTEVNLGIVDFGTNRSFELHLANLGLRLLYGSVTSDCKWLTLGDAPGNPQKLFQFAGDSPIHVQIRGKHLRAGNKPLEGHLLIESNGGTTTCTVRAEVPAKPFQGGVLAGATTPRQIAEKALVAPKEAAPLFEGGAVAKWFGTNGWTYPVQGPSASGVGGVQQFFEALGLAKAPKVDISHTSLALRGDVGQTIQATLELKAQEKRPVYGHAVCDQPWLDVSRTVLSGRNAAIKVVVPRVPNLPGETLQATVTVVANGNQKFKVPVNLEIGGTAPANAGVIPFADEVLPPIPMARAVAVSSAQPIMLAEAVLAEDAIADAVAVAVTEQPPSVIAAEAPFVPVPVRQRRATQATDASAAVRFGMHAVPAGLLALLLLVVLGRDIFFGSAKGSDDIATDPNPRIGVYFNMPENANRIPIIKGSMQFGIVEISKNPKVPGKKLTFDELGNTNSTIIRVGGIDHILGDPSAGTWTTVAEPLGDHGGKKSVWLYQRGNIKLQVSQLVEIVPGEPIEDQNHNLKRFYDTCVVRYVLENKGKEQIDAGLRMVIDTCIGVRADGKTPNDGVPFTVPGRKGLVEQEQKADFRSPKEVPDFIQVLEFPDLAKPGIIGFFNLKVGGNVEAPYRLSLTHWPHWTTHLYTWDVPVQPILDDSAVVLYWNPKPLKLGAKREVGFSYGLGSVSGAGGKLGLSVGGNFVINGDLTVVALVNNPEKGQTLTLKLPEGLEIVEGEFKQAVPPVPAGATVQQSPISWRILARRAGTFEIEVHSSTGFSQKKKITIKAKTIF